MLPAGRGPALPRPLLGLALLLLFAAPLAAGARPRTTPRPTFEQAEAAWEEYRVWHGQQVDRARVGDCEGVTYAIYRQRNGFGDDIGGMMGVLKHAFRVGAVFVVDGWLAEYLHPQLAAWRIETLGASGGLCSRELSTHLVVHGHVHTQSPILALPDVRDAGLLERYMGTLRRTLISPRPDLAARIARMQHEAGLTGKLVVALQIRTGAADEYGSPKFLGATRAEGAANARVFFDCAAGLLDVLDPAVLGAGGVAEHVRFFIASDDPDVVARARADARIGAQVVSFAERGAKVVHSMQASPEEKNEENALAMLADFFTLASAPVLFKTSTSLFGSQAFHVTELARVLYTVNDPLCGTAGHHRCAGNKPLPDTLATWQSTRESFRAQRLLSFGVAPLPTSCARSTVLENVYPPGKDGRAPLLGLLSPDAHAPQPAWVSSRTLFRATPWLTDPDYRHGSHGGEL